MKKNLLIVLLMLVTVGAKPLFAQSQKATNPIMFADVPDLSMVRVGDTYYMSSTTMHMTPGVPIMKSKDLSNWELINYAYQTLGNSDEMSLNNSKNVYGKGTWASCIRFHKGLYYVTTFAQNTNKTHIYTTTSLEKGPWKASTINGAYHDHTIHFEDDGKVYMIWGAGKLNIQELKPDLSDIIEGTRRVLIENASAPAGNAIMLGSEGSQLYKYNGKYYLFNICWPRNGMRTVVCHRADQITGPYEGKVVFQDMGVAQGSIVDTPDGRWFAYLFRDFGSVGRIPYLVPMTWVDGWPSIGVNGKVPETLDLPAIKGTMPSIVKSDEFTRKKGEPALPLVWQWNHNPVNTLWSVTERAGYLRLKTDRLDQTVLQARNTLTQRTFGPYSSGVTCLDVSKMKDGDVAGLVLFQAKYAQLAVEMKDGAKSIVMYNVERTRQPATEAQRVPLKKKKVYFKAECNFMDKKDVSRMFYSLDGKTWKKIGTDLKMEYSMPHFVGYRFGLYNYSTKTAGGYVDFDFLRISDKISTWN